MIKLPVGTDASPCPPRLRHDDRRHHDVHQRLRLHRQLPAHEPPHRLRPTQPQDHMTRGGLRQDTCSQSGERSQQRQVRPGRRNGPKSVNTHSKCVRPRHALDARAEKKLPHSDFCVRACSLFLHSESKSKTWTCGNVRLHVGGKKKRLLH